MRDAGGDVEAVARAEARVDVTGDDPKLPGRHVEKLVPRMRLVGARLTGQHPQGRDG